MYTPCPPDKGAWSSPGSSRRSSKNPRQHRRKLGTSFSENQLKIKTNFDDNMDSDSSLSRFKLRKAPKSAKTPLINRHNFNTTVKIKRELNQNFDFFIHEDAEEADHIANKILRGEKVDSVSTDVLKLTISNLEQRKSIFQARGDIYQTLKVNCAINTAKTLLIESSKNDIQFIEKLEVAIKEGHINTDEKIFNHISEQNLENAEAHFEEKKRQLQIRQEREIREHTKKWQSESKAREYNKPSTKLRDLRSQISILVCANRLDEASQLTIEANNLEKKETLEGIEKLKKEFLLSESKILERHAKERERLESETNQKRELIKQSINNQRAPLEHRKAALSQRKALASDRERLWARRAPKEISSEPRLQAPRTPSPELKLKLPPLQECIRSHRH